MQQRVHTKRTWLRIALMIALIAVPAAVAIGSHRFTDVPSSHVFHDDITWLADQGITRGCNPPANTRFCPDEPVTRGQMAAFMKRFADTMSGSGGGGSGSAGPTTRITQSGTGSTILPDDSWTTLATTRLTAPAGGGALYVDGTASLSTEFVDDLGGGGLIVATVNQSCSRNAAGPFAAWSTANLAGMDSAAVSGVFRVSSGTHTVRLCGWAFHLGEFERTEADAVISAIWFPSSQVVLQDDEAIEYPTLSELEESLRERVGTREG